jgi:hypothetical protein
MVTRYPEPTLPARDPKYLSENWGGVRILSECSGDALTQNAVLLYYSSLGRLLEATPAARRNLYG